MPLQLAGGAEVIARVDREALVALIEDLAFDLGVRPRIGQEAQRALELLSSAPPPARRRRANKTSRPCARASQRSRTRARSRPPRRSRRRPPRLPSSAPSATRRARHRRRVRAERPRLRASSRRSSRSPTSTRRSLPTPLEPLEPLQDVRAACRQRLVPALARGRPRDQRVLVPSRSRRRFTDDCSRSRALVRLLHRRRRRQLARAQAPRRHRASGWARPTTCSRASSRGEEVHRRLVRDRLPVRRAAQHRRRRASRTSPKQRAMYQQLWEQSMAGVPEARPRARSVDAARAAPPAGAAREPDRPRAAPRLR